MPGVFNVNAGDVNQEWHFLSGYLSFVGFIYHRMSGISHCSATGMSGRGVCLQLHFHEFSEAGGQFGQLKLVDHQFTLTLLTTLCLLLIKEHPYLTLLFAWDEW